MIVVPVNTNKKKDMKLGESHAKVESGSVLFFFFLLFDLVSIMDSLAVHMLGEE